MIRGSRTFAAIRRSVRTKVVAVVLATTLAALLVTAIALLTYDANSYRDLLVSEAATQADLLARMSTPALQFQDPSAAHENFAILASRQGIEAAALYTPTGEVFAQYTRDGLAPALPDIGKQPDGAPSPSSMHFPSEPRFSANSLELFHPVLANDRMIGVVYLRSGYDLTGRLQDYLLILGLVMWASLGVASLLSVYLQRSISAPVFAVTQTARRVIEDRNFSLRAVKSSDDEIGILVESFNSMLAEVERTTAALETSNRRLTEETEERRSAETALRIADQHKDDFLATLAHELRNPLAPMVNALQLIELSSDGSDVALARAQRAREIMRRQLAHMVRLIDDLLDVSRITRGKLAIQTETIELSGVMQNAIDTARPLIESRGHTLEVTMPPQPVWLTGDAIRLSQVFSNLLNNAAKYTEPGGHIRFSADTSNGRIRVVVADDGIGMTDDTRSMIFDMFTQGSAVAAQATHAGLGVGLGLAKRLVELHGGTVEVSSPGPGQGSTFVVQLALSAVPAEAAPAAAQAPSCTVDGETCRILLVDDNVDFATSLASLLQDLGHEVGLSHDAAGALEAAEALRPHIAFLDIGLPDMNGYELARCLRASATGRELILVALSGWGQERDRALSRAAGFAQHMIKPVNLDQIRATLDTLLRSP